MQKLKQNAQNRIETQMKRVNYRMIAEIFPSQSESRKMVTIIFSSSSTKTGRELNYVRNILLFAPQPLLLKICEFLNRSS